MITVNDKKYIEQINDAVRNQFYAEVKLYFSSGVRLYTSESITSLSDKQTAHLISGELPSQTTSVSILNNNGEFDANDTSGYYDELMKGIKMEFRLGFLINDVTDYVYWFPWNVRYTNGDVTREESQITIGATDWLAFMNDELEVTYRKPNMGDTLLTALSLSNYPTINGSVNIRYDKDLERIPVLFTPDVKNPKDILQSIAYAGCKQFYIGADGKLYITNDKLKEDFGQYVITTDERFEKSTEEKDKNVKSITIEFFSGSTDIKKKPIVENINEFGKELKISNDFITRSDIGTSVLNNIKSYLNNRNTCRCSFRADPRLEILDRVTLQLIDANDQIFDVKGTITGLSLLYDGSLTCDAEIKYPVERQTSGTISIIGAEDFIYPAESTTPNKDTITLTCKTQNIYNPTYKWEYYNELEARWTYLTNTSSVTINHTSEALVDDSYTTFRCTVNGRSASVDIRRDFVKISEYHYIGMSDKYPPYPNLGDYFLKSEEPNKGIVYVFNGTEWVPTEKSEILINCVVDGKKLNDIENTPLGKLIESLKGNDGNTFTPIIQYKYSKSYNNPESDSGTLIKSSAIYRHGSKIYVSTGEVWVNYVPKAEGHEGMYLWQRTWSYQTQSWNYARLTGDKGEDGEVAKVFDVAVSAQTYTISRRFHLEQLIFVYYELQGYKNNTVEITVKPDKDPLVQWDGSRLELILKKGVTTPTIVFTAIRKDENGVEQERKEITLTGVVKNDTPVYFGMREQDPPPETEKMEGDFYLRIDSNNDNIAIPMRYNGVEWVEAETVDSNYSEIMDTVGSDWMGQKKDITPTMTAMYGFYKSIFSTTVCTDTITTRELRLKGNGAIQSNEFTEGKKGFRIDSEGNSEFVNIKAVDGQFSGSFDTSVNGVKIFSVSNKNFTGTLSLTPSYWRFGDARHQMPYVGKLENSNRLLLKAYDKQTEHSKIYYLCDKRIPPHTQQAITAVTLTISPNIKVNLELHFNASAGGGLDGETATYHIYRNGSLIHSKTVVASGEWYDNYLVNDATGGDKFYITGVTPNSTALDVDIGIETSVRPNLQEKGPWDALECYTDKQNATIEKSYDVDDFLTGGLVIYDKNHPNNPPFDAEELIRQGYLIVYNSGYDMKNQLPINANIEFENDYYVVMWDDYQQRDPIYFYKCLIKSDTITLSGGMSGPKTFPLNKFFFQDFDDSTYKNMAYTADGSNVRFRNVEPLDANCSLGTPRLPFGEGYFTQIGSVDKYVSKLYVDEIIRRPKSAPMALAMPLAMSANAETSCIYLDNEHVLQWGKNKVGTTVHTFQVPFVKFIWGMGYALDENKFARIISTDGETFELKGDGTSEYEVNWIAFGKV